MTGRPIYINGRFLLGAKTAVNQVARRLTAALLERFEGDKTAPNLRVVVPHGAGDIPQGWPVLRIGRNSGPLWDQLNLPKLARRGVVINLTNAAPFFGRHYITLLHDAQVFDVEESYGRAVRRWRKAAARAAGRAGRSVLTVSAFSKDRLIANKIALPDQITVIPNGADHLPKVTRDIWQGGPSYVVAGGSILPHKNIALLFEAFEDRAMSGIELWITGSALRADYEAAGFNVPKNVRFTGFLSPRALSQTYAGAMAVCMPSLTEGFGLPVAEAMRLGTPAIVAPCGALPDTAGPNALIASPFDATEWVGAIIALKSDRALCDQLSEKSIDHAAQFQWATAGAQLADAILAVHSRQRVKGRAPSATSTMSGALT